MSDILEQGNIMATTAVKKTYYSANFSEFVRSEENYRENTNREQLTATIKADGGIRIPGVVLPSKYNIDGKRVIWDGNSRHASLEQLANDSEYKGSLDFLYIIMPEEIADDPIQRKSWMLSLGSTNEQLNPREYGKGVVEIVGLKEQQLIEKFILENGTEPDEKQIKKLHKQAVSFIALTQGKTDTWINQILRVQENPDETLQQALNDGVVDFALADVITAKSKKSDIESKEFLNLAVESAKQRGKNKITIKDVDRVVDVLEKGENVTNLVEKGVLPFSLIPEVEAIAVESGTDFIGLVSEAQDFLNNDDFETVLTVEHLNKAKEFITATPEDLQDSEDDESDQETENDSESDQGTEKTEVVLTTETVQLAKDKISDVALFFSNLSVQNYPDLSDELIVKLSNKLVKVSENILKAQEKAIKQRENEAEQSQAA